MHARAASWERGRCKPPGEQGSLLAREPVERDLRETVQCLQARDKLVQWMLRIQILAPGRCRDQHRSARLVP